MKRVRFLLASFFLLVASCSDASTTVPPEATGHAGAGGAGVGGRSVGGAAEGGDAVGGTAEGGGGSAGGGAAPFVLEVHTSLDENDVLVLDTTLPRSFDACTTIVGAPCEDADGDGLTDAWERLVIERLRPFVRLDEAEQLVDDPNFSLGVVARVTPVGAYVHTYMMLGYAFDFGSCGFTMHNGDSERVALQLEPIAGTLGDVRVRQAYTAAHEGTVTDGSRVISNAELGTLVHETDPNHDEPRWVVFASADKHATYPTIALCENVAPGVPCADEDCAPDNVADLTPFTRLFPFVNAGEPTAPLVTDLSGLGFAGDDAWAEQNFCGGLGGSGCSSPVRDKLTIDPF